MLHVWLTSLKQKIVNLDMGPRNKNKPDSQVMKEGYILQHAPHYIAKYGEQLNGAASRKNFFYYFEKYI